MGIGDWGLGIGNWGLGKMRNDKELITKNKSQKHKKKIN